MNLSKEITGISNRHRARRHTLWLRVGVPLLGILAIASPATTDAQHRNIGEYDVKAGFLLNFVRFVEWPESAFTNAQAPLVIGVLGQRPFGWSLDSSVKNRTFNGRPLQVRYLKDIKDIRSCHMLFVSSSEDRQIDEVLEAVAGSSVLTVGESPRFSKSGGMFTFFVVDNRVQIEINLSKTAPAFLKVSAKLLGVAKVAREVEVQGSH